MTEFTREDAMGVMAEVRENRARIDGCVGHYLLPPAKRPGRVLSTVRCSVCDGELGYPEARGYVAGWVAAGRRAEDAWPWWAAQGCAQDAAGTADGG